MSSPSICRPMLVTLPTTRARWRMLWCALVIGALTACGGGENSDKVAADPATTATITNKSAEVPVTKSAASRVPVYRFFNTLTSAHFFTTSEAEKASVQATKPFMTYEGPAFYASSTAIAGLSPVYRLYNTATGVHFYTISEAEKNSIVATLPQFSYEGVAYYASTLSGTGYTPLYRFFYTAKGFHFYSNSSTERDSIIATLPQYHYEGIGYYVLGSDWQTPAVPHTGITGAQCYQGGGNFTLGSCGTTGAINLNPQQDGHRAAVNPMSYGSVTVGATTYPNTSCVKDNVTGLIWEGKESAALALRSGFKLYTNLGGNSSSTDASAYVVAVNAFKLCGFNDWRLPNVEELQGLVDYGRAVGARYNTTVFPNSQGAYYWTSMPNANPALAAEAWVVNFYNGAVFRALRADSHYVRLVRGAAWTGQRHLVTTQPYPGDSANNAVIDRKTGLTWRRCQQGRTWNGSTCTGTASSFFLEAALSHARSQAGWRMPNVKELNSITDYSRYVPALDTTLFPGDNGLNVSSTPWLDNSSYTFYVQSIDGYVGFGGGASTLRLVATSP
ncbi:DUF1566 domain-containing protein [Hydrogenophaga sp. MI9]|uniref:DUF1566 domain-containing protein n=1 Tax=Hydrogenophaga sp. MI9 TaxID=3453719 RepID=UPI003EEC6EBD